MLSGTVVDHLKSKQKLTCFAFLTYQDENISALSIVHSLIFQLAESDDELMAFVCQSNLEDLKSSLESAAELLKFMILHVGSVCLVIDGVDEIREAERVRVVGQLVELVESHTGLTAILSSRPEADLMHTLAKAAVAIQVHEHNEQNITSFVMHYTEKMFVHRQITRRDHQNEMRTLLAPVAKHAKGIFLYARLIMNMVNEMTDMAEIQNHLTVLPEDLDDAYEPPDRYDRPQLTSHAQVSPDHFAPG